jgi:hypothetical protein
LARFGHIADIGGSLKFANRRISFAARRSYSILLEQEHRQKPAGVVEFGYAVVNRARCTNAWLNETLFASNCAWPVSLIERFTPLPICFTSGTNSP